MKTNFLLLSVFYLSLQMQHLFSQSMDTEHRLYPGHYTRRWPSGCPYMSEKTDVEQAITLKATPFLQLPRAILHVSLSLIPWIQSFKKFF